MAEITPAEYSRKMDELFALEEQWQEAFGEPIGIGFAVTIDDIPRIRRCLKAGSPKELHDRIERDVKAGKVF